MWGRSTSAPEALSIEQRYNIPYFNQLFEQLNKHRQPATFKEDQVIEVVRGLAELLLYGEARGDEKMFECFGYHNTLQIFLTLVREPRVHVQAQVIQTLTILLFNVKRDIVLTYLLSNNHINDIINHDFDFEHEEIRDPYINLLRTIAMRITQHTAALFFNQRQRTGLAYCPLFKRAITFLSHPERLARTAARTVALSLYRVEEHDMRVFLLSDACKKAVLKELSGMLTRHCNRLFLLLKDFDVRKRSSIETELCDLQDELCFVQDLLDTGLRSLNEALALHLMEHFVQALLLPAILTPTQSHITQPPSPQQTEPTADGTDSASSLSCVEPTVPSGLGGAASPNSADLCMFQQVALFLLAQIFTFLSHPCLVRVLALTLLHPQDLRLMERQASHSPFAQADKDPKNDSEASAASRGSHEARSSPVGPSRASLSPSACLDPCASPNPLRARLLSCLSPQSHDGLTLTATLLLCKMLTNPGLAQSNLLALLGFPYQRPQRAPPPEDEPGVSDGPEGSGGGQEGNGSGSGKKPSHSRVLELLTEPPPQDEQEDEAALLLTPPPQGQGRMPPAPPARQDGGAEGEQVEEASCRRGRGALFEDDVDDEHEAFETPSHAHEAEEKVLVNVLGYRAKSKAALAGRRGSLRTGVVAVRSRDVRDAHLLFARQALEVLASASERRPITLKALVRLLTLLLGIQLDPPPDAPPTHHEEGGEKREEGPRLALLSEALGAASSRLFSDRPTPPHGQTDVLLEVLEQAVCSSGASVGVLQGWSSAVEGSLNQPPSLWSTVPRLACEAAALLPQDYRLPAGGVEGSRCRVSAFLALRALYRRLHFGPHDKDDEMQGVAAVLRRPLHVGVCEGEADVMDLHGLDALPCTCPLPSPPKPPTPQRGASGASPAKASTGPATPANGNGATATPPALSQLYLILHAHAFLLAAPHRSKRSSKPKPVTRQRPRHSSSSSSSSSSGCLSPCPPAWLPESEVCEVSIQAAHPQQLQLSTHYVDKAHPRSHVLQPSRGAPPSPCPPTDRAAQPRGPQPVSSEPPLYVVVLDFDDAEKCKNAWAHLEEGRLRSTQARWAHLRPLLHSPPPPPTPVPIAAERPLRGVGNELSCALEWEERDRREEAAVQDLSDVLPEPRGGRVGDLARHGAPDESPLRREALAKTTEEGGPRA